MESAVNEECQGFYVKMAHCFIQPLVISYTNGLCSYSFGFAGKKAA